jgi:probable DNA metabolism protein
MISVRLSSQTDVKGWREAARRLRLSDIPPDHVRWGVGEDAGLFADSPLPDPPPGAVFTVPKAFLKLADAALINRAEDRFDLMYRLLWRLKAEPDLLAIVTDPEVDQALGYEKAVNQAAHKMHAYVRFRRVDDPEDDETPEEYAAWFVSPHYVLAWGADFFVKRMANLRFTIITPDATAVWDTQKLRFGPGGDPGQVPAEDAKEDAWKTYFTSIFNPARLNPKVMTQHMAKHYWRNLPEAELIPQMIENAGARAAAMVAATPTIPSERAMKIAARRSRDEPVDGGIAPETLQILAAGVQHCRRCELWRDATQGVTGEGPSHAAIMVVGEQPGDMEDLRGRPFVGPAGELFNRALAEAGIGRETLYVTNAVKHFKHELRGKRRLHKTPAAGEVKACRWWLDNELRLVKPKVIVALGSTAATAVLKRPVSVLKERGAAEALERGGRGFITVHPSYLLRIPDEAARTQGFRDFVRDLAAAKELASG